MNFIKKLNKKVLISLMIIIIITLCVNLYQRGVIPLCLNSDEAAFGYNSYSILNTLRDEHGALLPLRLQSFADFKLPLYSYFSMPFIALFGLTIQSVRMLNIFVSVGLALSTYFLAKKITESELVSLLSGIIVSTSMWTLIVTRHAHEASLAALFITISLYFLVCFHKERKNSQFILTLLFALLSAFAYHIGRILLPFITIVSVISLFKNKENISKKIFGLLFAIFIFCIPFLVDSHYSTNRLNHLAFYKNIGFTLRINEYLSEHPNRAIHNKGVQGVVFLTNNYLKQLSTEFLVIKGDSNGRFGFTEMGPITPIIYFLLLIGLYGLFRKGNQYRYLLLGLLLLSPVGNALTWQENSLTRTFFMIVPISILSAYGGIFLFEELNLIGKKLKLAHFGKIIFGMVIFAHLFYLTLTYDVYFNHYFKRVATQNSWQCGYKELSHYVKKNYNKFDRFYITLKNGQPYIFLLYFNKMDPTLFQSSQKRSSIDLFGFTQVTKFDKIIFEMPSRKTEKNTVYIGFPDELESGEVTSKIQFQGRDIYWVKENK